MFMMLPLILLGSIATLQSMRSRSFNFWAVWFKQPNKGPLVVVEIVGVDLEAKSANTFDLWSKPDIMVEIKHSTWERTSNIEGNTLRARFFWQTKIPYQAREGFMFTVYDANILEGNEIIGRAYLSPEDVKALLEPVGENEKRRSRKLSIGAGIGKIKVKIFHAPKHLAPDDRDLDDSEHDEKE